MFIHAIKIFSLIIGVDLVWSLCSTHKPIGSRIGNFNKDLKLLDKIDGHNIEIYTSDSTVCVFPDIICTEKTQR